MLGALSQGPEGAPHAARGPLPRGAEVGASSARLPLHGRPLPDAGPVSEAPGRPALLRVGHKNAGEASRCRVTGTLGPAPCAGAWSHRHTSLTALGIMSTDGEGARHRVPQASRPVGAAARRAPRSENFPWTCRAARGGRLGGSCGLQQQSHSEGILALTPSRTSGTAPCSERPPWPSGP